MEKNNKRLKAIMEEIDGGVLLLIILTLFFLFTRGNWESFLAAYLIIMNLKE